MTRDTPETGDIVPIQQLGLPLAQEISGEVLIEKYAKGNERSVHDVRDRVARALAAIENEDKRALWHQRHRAGRHVAVGAVGHAADPRHGKRRIGVLPFDFCARGRQGSRKRRGQDKN